jgi:hypothetical protein
MTTSRVTVQPRGICPLCKRSVAVLTDGTVARPHKDKQKVPCAGYGLVGWLAEVA